MTNEKQQPPKDIPGVTRPFTLGEASREVLRRFTEKGALDPISLPADSKEIPGGGIVYWNPLTEKVTVHAYSRDAIQKAQGESGRVISTGLTGSSEIIDKPQPPRDSQN